MASTCGRGRIKKHTVIFLSILVRSQHGTMSWDNPNLLDVSKKSCSFILRSAEKLHFNLQRWTWSIGHIRSNLNFGRLSSWNHKLQQHQTIQCCATAVSCHNRRWVWFLSRHTCFYCFHTSKWWMLRDSDWVGIQSSHWGAASKHC